MHGYGRAHSMCVTTWKKLHESEFEKNTCYKILLMKYSKKWVILQRQKTSMVAKGSNWGKMTVE